jgi:hypothetical protein
MVGPARADWTRDGNGFWCYTTEMGLQAMEDVFSVSGAAVRGP